MPHSEINLTICPTCGKPIPLNMKCQQCPTCLLTTNFNLELEDGDSFLCNLLPSAEELEMLCPDFIDWQFLGKGGMGTVFKALQKELQRPVAIKLLPIEITQHPIAIEQFKHEAKILAQMNHPDIVTIYDLKQNDQFYYLVMELALGENLQQILQRRSTPFTFKEVLPLVKLICEAMTYAHQHGIIHRDLKPENILLSSGPKIEIIDFGIATLLSGTIPHSSGTPAYMSPEQREGQMIDSRSDQYSLALVIFQMLTKIRPSGYLPITSSAIPKSLYRILARATQVDPEKRFPSMMAFYQALARYQKLNWLSLKRIKQFFFTTSLVGLLYYLYYFNHAFNERTFAVENFLQNMNEILQGAKNFYLFFAVVGTGFFALQLILGHLGDSDGFDADADDVPDTLVSDLSDSTFLTIMRFFSIRTMVTFSMFFGWGGVIWYQMGWLGLLFSLLLGLGMAIIVAWIMSLLWKLQQVNQITDKELVGQKGKVYLTIPAGKQPGGRITVILDSCTREMGAIAEETIATGEIVEILSCEDNECVLVKKI